MNLNGTFGVTLTQLVCGAKRKAIGQIQVFIHP